MDEQDVIGLTERLETLGCVFLSTRARSEQVVPAEAGELGPFRLLAQREAISRLRRNYIEEANYYDLSPMSQPVIEWFTGVESQYTLSPGRLYFQPRLDLSGVLVDQSRDFVVFANRVLKVAKDFAETSVAPWGKIRIAPSARRRYMRKELKLSPV